MSNETSVFLAFEVESALKGVGRLLRQARLARKLSETQAAQRLNVSRATWVRIEAGDPNVRSGTLLQALTLFHMNSRVVALAEPDPMTTALALTGLPKRGSSSKPKTRGTANTEQFNEGKIDVT